MRERRSGLSGALADLKVTPSSRLVMNTYGSPDRSIRAQEIGSPWERRGAGGAQIGLSCQRLGGFAFQVTQVAGIPNGTVNPRGAARPAVDSAATFVVAINQTETENDGVDVVGIETVLQVDALAHG